MKLQYKKTFIVALLSHIILTASATAGQDSQTDIPPVLRPLMFVKNLIDTMAVSGIDRQYIEVPKRPWHVVLRGNMNQTDLKMKSNIDMGNALIGKPLGYELQWEPRIKNTPSTYAGVWAGYRGYGVGYSKNIAGDKGSYLTFGAMGGSFGINLRVHRFETDEPSVHYKSNMEELGENTDIFELNAPIKINTLILDGYYMFNGRHFSYAAAYDQSTVQLQSAGSLMAGAMYYYSHTNFASNSNVPLIIFMDDIGQMRQWQLCVGAGYAYNWVPAKGWLVSAMFMPMLTVLNRIKTNKYHCFVVEGEDKKLIKNVENFDELDESTFSIEPKEEKAENSRPRLNFDARLSLTYQWDRYYVNAYGQLNNFKYKQDNNWGRLTDWLAWLQLGVRF